MPLRASVLFAALLAIPGCGSGTSAPADLVLEQVRVLDIAEGTLKEATVVIAGERITAVLPDPDAPHVRAVRRIDGEGAIVMPGLIDTHVHLIFVEALSEGGSNDSVVATFIRDGLPERLMAFLAHGVTTVKTTGDYFPHILAVRGAIANGELIGPRVFTTGPVFTAPGGHPAGTLCHTEWCRQHVTVQVETAEAAREEVRRLAAEGVDAVKVAYQQARRDREIPALSPEVLAAIIDEAHRHRLRVTVHTNSEREALEAVRSGADGLEHGVLDQALSGDALLNALRERGTTYAPTLRIWPREERYLRHPMANLHRAWQAGVRIVLGSDTYYAPWAESPGSWTVTELEWMAEAGLSRRDVLLAGTRTAAEHLGVLAELGTIEPGKLADLVVLDGNPLDDLSVLRRPRLVIVGGRIVIESQPTGTVLP